MNTKRMKELEKLNKRLFEKKEKGKKQKEKQKNKIVESRYFQMWSGDMPENTVKLLVDFLNFAIANKYVVSYQKDLIRANLHES